MIEKAFRLHKNDDLRKCIENECEDFNTVVVLSSVGSLSHLHIRLAKANSFLDLNDDFEILSLNGTISNGKAHLHICVSDDKGKTYGGHLSDNCIINTTCELVLGILESYESTREYDLETNFDEIVFKEIEK